MLKHGDNKSTATTTVSISGLLGIAFVVLKLCGAINWPWIAVLAPFWVPVAIAILFIIIGCVIFFIFDSRE